MLFVAERCCGFKTQRPLRLRCNAAGLRMLKTTDRSLSAPRFVPSDNGPAPVLSMVLCTIGRTREVTRLLTSLLHQSFSDFEIVLVDQNSPGYLKDILEQFGGRLSVHAVRSDVGLSRARNVGLKFARGRIICFPDDDCWYERDVAKRVFDFFDRNSDIDVLLGRTVAQDGLTSTGPFC